MYVCTLRCGHGNLMFASMGLSISKWPMYFNFSKYPRCACIRMVCGFTTLLGCFVCCNVISPGTTHVLYTIDACVHEDESLTIRALGVTDIFQFITSCYSAQYSSKCISYYRDVSKID